MNVYEIQFAGEFHCDTFRLRNFQDRLPADQKDRRKYLTSFPFKKNI